MEYKHKRNIVVSMCVFLYASPSLAFKPKADYGHVAIVKDGIETITRTTTTGEVIRFSDRAIEQLRDATAGVDEFFSSRGEILVPEAHCDDELLRECSQRVIDIKESTISILTDEASRDGEAARAEAGRALHTLQDFYSHSNWVNNPGLGNVGINPRFGRSTLTALPLTANTCVDDLFDWTLTGDGLTSVTSGYFPLDADDIDGIVGEPPPGKCAHGRPKLGPFTYFGGIHKDFPGRAFHAQARAAATLATRNYINQILDAPGVAGNDDAIRAFMDVRGTLGFVVDNTGSMGGVIAGVRSQVQRMVRAIDALPDKKPDDYLLVEFGDPDVGAPFKTTDARTFSSRVNSIGASGGGDCPELANSGLLKAVGSASGGSKLFFFSDASAKDSYLGGNVAAAAADKKISINYILTGSCSSSAAGQIDPAGLDPSALIIDSSYTRVAQDTGGQVFVIPTGQVESIYSLIEPVLSGSFQPISIINGTLASETKSFDIPVDSSMESVFVSVSLDSVGSITLMRPDGSEATGADADVTVTDLSTGRIYSVSSPEAGEWDLSVTGSGSLSLSIQGDSDIEFNDFSFVDIAGRPGHKGFFAIDGQPLTGVDHFTRARLFGLVANLEFSLVTLDGDFIRTVAMAAGGVDENSANDDYVGNMIVPTESFRVVVSGLDSSGAAFQRIFPKSFIGQSLKVSAVDTYVDLPAGGAVAVKFKVENNGARSEVFDFSAADNLGYVVSVTPDSGRIGAGGARQVSVLMAAPATALAEVGTLSLVAQSQTNADLTNSALVSVSVVQEPVEPMFECNGKVATIVGTEGDDILRGTSGNDVIVGLGGNDIIYGNGGADTLCGDRGSDQLYGGVGDDVLLGGIGNDVLVGSNGDDILRGENGSDKLIGSYGDDKLYGGLGKDRLYGNSGHDELRGEDSNDLISGGSGADIILGGNGNDTMSGDSNNDIIKGGTGNDVIDGGTGHDTLNGNAGRDKIQGGSGMDDIKGGPDSDRCAADSFPSVAAALGALEQATAEDFEFFDDGSNKVLDEPEQINGINPVKDTASSCEVKIGY